MHINQKVELWGVQYDHRDDTYTVYRKVIVTITDIKTGVPGQVTGQPVPLQSLRGRGDDGRTYEKHWNFWPQAETWHFDNEWTPRNDGEEPERHWVPMEAVAIYNWHGSKSSGKKVYVIRNIAGEVMVPQGDIVFCKEHDRYGYYGCSICAQRA